MNLVTQDYIIDEFEDSIKMKVDLLNKQSIKNQHLRSSFQERGLKHKSMTTINIKTPIVLSIESDDDSSEIKMTDTEVQQENKLSDILCHYKDSYFNEKIKNFNECKTQKGFCPKKEASQIQNISVAESKSEGIKKQSDLQNFIQNQNSPISEYRGKYQLSRVSSNYSRGQISLNFQQSIENSNYTIDLPYNEQVSLNSQKQLLKFSDKELQNILIESIFKKDQNKLVQILVLLQKEYRNDILNNFDMNGNTILMLAIKVNYSIPQYETIRLLLANGADPSIRDKNGWSPIEECVAQMDLVNTSIIFDYLVKKKIFEVQQERSKIDQELGQIEDFQIEMKWEFHSNLIPFLSKFAPSDVFKIYKRGSSLRLDSTYAGMKNLSAKRRNISVLYNPLAGKIQRRENQSNCKFLVMLNKTKKIFFYPIQEIDAEEKKQMLLDLINCESVSGQIKIHGCRLQTCKTIFGNDISQKIGNYNCKKYDFKVDFDQSFNKKNHRNLFTNYEQYTASLFSEQQSSARFGFDPQPLLFENLHLQSQQFQNFPNQQQEKKIQHKSCSMFITQSFPLTFHQLLPIIKMLGKGNEFIQNLENILVDEKVQNLLNTNGFPLKIEIPISYTIDAVVTFQAYKKLNFDEQTSIDLFQIPEDLRYMNRKDAQKVMLREKKRLLLANFFL